MPYIDVREYPCDDDPSKGYLLVLVPQSARAPHQVTVGGDLRFYGRGAKGNRRLTEGDVARLYQRRQEWQQNRDVLLAEAVAQAPFAPQDDLAYLHAFVRPVAPDRATWDRAVAAAGQRSALQQQLDFQLAATGMFPVRMRLGHRVYHAPERVLRARDARPRPGCRWCDRHAPAGAFGRGDDHPLPLRSESAPRPAPNGAREWIGRLLRPR